MDQNKFTTWYSAEVQKQVNSRVNFEDVNVERKLSVSKPIHATWLVEMYNFFTSARGRVHLERMGESGNKGGSNWKRSIFVCWSMSRHLHKWLVTFVYMFLNGVMLLSGIIFSSESIGSNFQCKWILWLIDSRAIIHVQAWTACGHYENCFIVTVDI